MTTTLIQTIRSQERPFGMPETVFFSYRSGSIDPPDIQEALKKSRSVREVSWSDAEAPLIALGAKPAPHVRVDTAKYTLHFGHADCIGWRLLQAKLRVVPRGAGAA